MNCFKTPQHTNTRIKYSTESTNPLNNTEEDETNCSQNVKRRLVFEENVENAFIKTNNIFINVELYTDKNVAKSGYNGIPGIYNKT